MTTKKQLAVIGGAATVVAALTKGRRGWQREHTAAVIIGGLVSVISAVS